ncbi:MAG: hypothetical protein ACI4N3_04840 [Alphaproteobacteria bacterium]
MENKETFKKIHSLNNDLYAQIDSCIDDIVLSRLHQERDVEARAMFEMESLMVCTLQHLGWINQELEEMLEKKK